MLTIFARVNEEHGDLDRKFRRIRWVKRVLKYMPRRASIHRYPVLNRFADVARRRSYLWSFRVIDVVPAFHIGWIITLVPIPSVFQMVIAFMMAVLCRANMMVLVGLQLLSNPFTFLFLWTITHKVGALVVSILGTDAIKLIHETYGMEFTWTISNCGRAAIRWLATMLVGALTLGPVLGFVSSTIYKCFAKNFAKNREAREQMRR